MSRFEKGHITWNKGLHPKSNGVLENYVRTIGPWNKQHYFNTCVECGERFHVRPCHYMKKKFCSSECFHDHPKHWMIKDKNPRWNGGSTILNSTIRSLFQSRQWTSDVFKRDDFTCQKCGVRGGRLEAHHLKQFQTIMREYSIKTVEDAVNCAELWDINNGQTLCEGCHTNTEHIQFMKGVKGVFKANSGTFKKGNIPWNKNS